MLHSPHELYLQAPDSVPRLMNQTFYERFYLDEDGAVAEAVLNSPFQ
jgi:site-specific DNA recombinase